MKKISVSLMVLFLMAFVQTAAMADSNGPGSSWMFRTIDGKIMDINKQAREITLKDTLGNVVTLAVDQKVKQFEVLNAGNKIRVNYYVSVATEVRKPTPEEKKTPFLKLDETVDAPPRATLGTVLSTYHEIVSIKMIDEGLGMLVVKSSQGKEYWVSCPSQAQLQNAAIGDTVIVKYTQPYIISLKKM